MMRGVVLGVLLGAATASATGFPPTWRTYRSDRFGWALAYPPAVELRAYSGGQSGELRDRASGALLAALEVWPSDTCPAEHDGETAETLGIARVMSVTQADGADGSSSCATPIRLRRFSAAAGASIFEVRLTCRSERVVDGRTVDHLEGMKGPIFFADVSQPWRTRVLTVDPIGVDPRTAKQGEADVALVREVLATLELAALPAPNATCIGDVPTSRPTAASPMGR